MKKKLILMLAPCLLLTGCSGLPAAREMEDMALLRTLGVDSSQAGVSVTGSTGPRARGLQAEGEPALTLSADRASLSSACLAMQGQSDSFVFFGYVDQLLIGEELARQGIQPVLDYFARDQELGLGAQMWLVRGASAREAVDAGGEEGVDRRLETLQHDSEMGVAAIARTAGEVYTDLLELGHAFVPTLSLSDGENSSLTENGYGVFQDFALAGFLDGEAARGLELLYGGPFADILEMDLPENKVSVKVISACTKSALDFSGDIPSALKLTCSVGAKLAEYQKRPEDRELEVLRAALEERERARLEGALEQLRTWGADCTGLGAKAAMACPARWQKMQADRADWFSQIPIDIEIRIELNS